MIGRLPTADEARAFLADASPSKRETLIDGLLVREEYADYTPQGRPTHLVSDPTPIAELMG